MVKHHYPSLFKEGTPEHSLALDISSRIYEFTEYLVNVIKVTDVGAAYPHKVTYHASCHYLREMGLKTEAKTLLSCVKGLEFIPLREEETCCGFGGAFTVTYPEVSRSMMENKVRDIVASGADTVVMCEPGCLMNVAGGLHKAGSNIRAMHIIDLLSAREGIGMSHEVPPTLVLKNTVSTCLPAFPRRYSRQQADSSVDAPRAWPNCPNGNSCARSGLTSACTPSKTWTSI